MLARAHVAPFLRERGGALHVELLPSSPKLLRFLDRLCRLARRLEGRPRRVVAEALRRQERRVGDHHRLRGIAKALLDACQFLPPPGAGRAAEVRAALFRARGRRWPPRPGDRDAPYRDAGEALGISPAEVARLLYADGPTERVLARAAALDGAALLERYNLELARGVLLGATRVTVRAGSGWGDLFRSVKLARLMYVVRRAGDGTYEVELTGPAAPFVRRADRYGARLARIVPALARAPGWSLEAEVVARGGRRLPFRLDARSFPAPPGGPRYDSSWERALADDFAERLAGERGGWTLSREATPVPLEAGEEMFFPDFTLRHRDGREALVEVVGFWTPEYLEAKLRKVAAAGLGNLVLVVYKDLAAGALTALGSDRVVRFGKRPRIAPVLEAAERVATAPPVARPRKPRRRT